MRQAGAQALGALDGEVLRRGTRGRTVMRRGSAGKGSKRKTFTKMDLCVPTQSVNKHVMILFGRGLVSPLENREKKAAVNLYFRAN